MLTIILMTILSSTLIVKMCQGCAATITAYCDGDLMYYYSVDGGVTNKAPEFYNSLMTPFTSTIPCDDINEDTEVVFICVYTDTNNNDGGFIANIERLGSIYATVNPLSSSRYSTVNTNLIYPIRSGFDDVVGSWVWNTVGRIMVFEFSFMNLIGTSTCTVSGDPHYTNFDGLRHHYQGDCNYILAQDCIDDDITGTEFDSFRVISNNRPCGSQTCLEELFIQLKDNSILELNAQKINNVVVTYPADFGGVTNAVRQDGPTKLLDLSSTIGLKVSIHASVGIVEISNGYSGRMCGLCGNNNNNPLDDLEKRDGSLTIYNRNAVQQFSNQAGINVVQAFGNDWIEPPNSPTCVDAIVDVPCNTFNDATKTSITTKCENIGDLPQFEGCEEVLGANFGATLDCFFDTCACLDGIANPPSVNQIDTCIEGETTQFYKDACDAINPEDAAILFIQFPYNNDIIRFELTKQADGSFLHVDVANGCQDVLSPSGLPLGFPQWILSTQCSPILGSTTLFYQGLDLNGDLIPENGNLGFESRFAGTINGNTVVVNAELRARPFWLD